MSIGPDSIQLQRTLAGVLAHPNVAAAVIMGLGCEVNQIEHYLGPNAPRSSRLVGMTVQDSGGTEGAVAAARKAILSLMDEASAEERKEVPASKIVLGLNCGGSDSFSGITANPALGYTSDLLAEIGATSVLAETTEIFGAEHLLVQRARNRQVAEKLLGFVKGYKKYLNQFGGSFDDNPSPGNKAGGLTNILEKSLGAVAKAGTSMMTDAVDYAQRITTPGFVFMNTPGYDPVSLTGLAAGGCNVIAFTTGRGSAIGFPSIPVVKIASNSFTYNRMTGNMDINAGLIADGERTVPQIGPGDIRYGAARRFGRTYLRRTAGPQGIRALAHWAGNVMKNFLIVSTHELLDGGCTAAQSQTGCCESRLSTRPRLRLISGI